jgi:hypothetical protein
LAPLTVVAPAVLQDDAKFPIVQALHEARGIRRHCGLVVARTGALPFGAAFT